MVIYYDQKKSRDYAQFYFMRKWSGQINEKDDITAYSIVKLKYFANTNTKQMRKLRIIIQDKARQKKFVQTHTHMNTHSSRTELLVPLISLVLSRSSRHRSSTVNHATNIFLTV